MLFSKAKPHKNFRALRAQRHPKPRGVSNFFACGAIRLGGFYNFTEIHQFGLGGGVQRGGFYFELPGILFDTCIIQKCIFFAGGMSKLLIVTIITLVEPS